MHSFINANIICELCDTIALYYTQLLEGSLCEPWKHKKNINKIFAICSSYKIMEKIWSKQRQCTFVYKYKVIHTYITYELWAKA